MKTAAPAISVAALSKSYGSTRAVDALDFEVHAGEVFGLLGPNGAGKTTTVEVLEGYRRPDSGTVRVLGLDPVRDARALRPRVGVMLQAGGIPPSVPATDYLALLSRFHTSPVEVPVLLDLVGLTSVARTPYKRLSGGQIRRAGLFPDRPFAASTEFATDKNQSFAVPFFFLCVVFRISSDMRTLRASPAPEAAEAIALFVHRIVRETGSLAAAMGGIDGIVFTAGIGENDVATRLDVMQACGWLGVKADQALNTKAEGRISAQGSPISAWVIPTDEERMIARHTRTVIGIR